LRCGYPGTWHCATGSSPWCSSEHWALSCTRQSRLYGPSYDPYISDSDNSWSVSCVNNIDPGHPTINTRTGNQKTNVGENVREIKFRVWDNKYKNYAPLECVMGFFWKNDKKNKKLILGGDFTEGYSFIIEQYTGLKDKNGKEIHENDRVELDGFKPKEYTVEFIEGSFCFTHPNIKGYPIDINMVYGSTGPNVEIIGNIHEEQK